MKRIFATLLFGLMIFSFSGVQNYIAFQEEGKIEMSSDLDSETELDLDNELTKFALFENADLNHLISSIEYCLQIIQESLLPISYEVEIRPPRA